MLLKNQKVVSDEEYEEALEYLSIHGVQIHSY